MSDQMLDTASSDPGNLVPRPTQVSLDDLIQTFTESQLRAFQWVKDKLDSNEQVQAAIIGPAGTGKSYLLKGLIELCKSKNLVVSKLAPSGVAAHLIGGTTVHNMFALDIEYNSLLEEGTVQAAKVRKTDVLIIDEFSMLDYFLLCTAEGLCRKYGRKGCSSTPWAGRHVIMLGDPAQLPAVSQKDIFDSKLWSKFSILLLREVKRATDPVLCNILGKIRMGDCDEEVTSVLKSRVRPKDVSDIELQRTVVICSTRKECEELNSACIDRVEGNEVVYEALDSDHHGHPLREADLERLQRHRERLPDKLVLKVGARVVLRRNLNIEGGWVNGTLAVVTHLHDNCIIIRKLTNPSQRYPIPRFRQRITIPGASYSIMRQQFPLQLAYAVTVHRVQECTVQKAIVCLNDQFFESGQAYVALSRVRNLEDLILWDFDASAVYLSAFYKQLLHWCDYVDVIRPTKPQDVVEYPIREVNNEDDLMSVHSDEELPQKAPIPFSDAHNDDDVSEPQPKRKRGRPQKNPSEPSQSAKLPKQRKGRPRKEPIQSSQPAKASESGGPKRGRGRPKKQSLNALAAEAKQKQPQTTSAEPKRKRGRPRKLVSEFDNPTSSEPAQDEGPPPHKNPKTSETEVQVIPTVPVVSPLQQFHSHVYATMHGRSARRILRELSRNSVDSVCTDMLSDSTMYDSIVQELNGLPHVYASQYPHLQQDPIILSLFHPVLFHTFKPVVTTGDGSCMYHALSLVLTGTETYTDLMRLLAAYALVQHKQTVLSAIQDVYPTHSAANVRSVHTECIKEALDVRKWGTDYHLFALCHLFNRSIIHYNTMPNNARTFLGVSTAQQMADCFLSNEVDTQEQCISCTNVHEALLSNGDISQLPHPPVAIINNASYHWVALLPVTQSAMQHIDIEFLRNE